MEAMPEKLGPVGGRNQGFPAPVLEKTDLIGGNQGFPFDDGVFDGVKKITIGKFSDSVSYMKIEYEKNGKLETREHGTVRREQQEFVVDYPNEYITSMGGSYSPLVGYDTDVIRTLFFKTSLGRTSPIFGGTNPTENEFMLEAKNGGKLVGFHGCSYYYMNAIGAYFLSLPTPKPKKTDAMGGNLGDVFDDGVFDGVKKITVGKDHECVTYIKIEYEKDGNFVIREHGTIRGELQEFVVDYPNDYITSVGGSYGHVIGYRTVMITSLIFKTSNGRTSPILGVSNSSGNEFMFEDKDGGKLLGFHGRSGSAIDAIGVYLGIGSGRLEKLELRIGEGSGSEGT